MGNADYVNIETFVQNLADTYGFNAPFCTTLDPEQLALLLGEDVPDVLPATEENFIAACREACTGEAGAGLDAARNVTYREVSHGASYHTRISQPQ